MIYTTREINVNGSTATIDEDIYLFKQDSNIELKFIINNTRFTFQTTESTNVVESSNASYFRVKLLNPYGKTINFPIQEVTDNFIVLLITEELIDEDTEVGDYTIQIRLYDKDKNSKLTLPAITNCIHIQQPIFSEVEESTVDTAAIDTASVMESDEGELPVVDSTGKYIPTLWNTGDTISKAKINHIEKGILQAHIDALTNKIPKVTPPTSKPHTKPPTSNIVTFYNMLPDSGPVYITQPYYLDDGVVVGYLCDVKTFPQEDTAPPYKMITCGATGTYVDVSSTGEILHSGICNSKLYNIVNAMESPGKEGQVLTRLNNNKYGWKDTIPQITPPKGQTTSDIVTVYNELPEKGLVYFTDSYNISDAYIIGLCYIDPYIDNQKPAKTIICTSTAIYVNITSTGDITGTGVTNNDLDEFITNVLKNPNRKKGQVLTMTSNSEYGWGDVIPQITPPEKSTTSDNVTLYNKLPESGLVYFTNGYTFSNEDTGIIPIIGLCTIVSGTTSDKKQYKSIGCYDTGLYANLTPDGNIVGNGMLNMFLDTVLNDPQRKKGQVLTMTGDSTYGWADTTPKLCIHNITGNAEVQLTLDPYQLINISDDSSSNYTVEILTPNIEESDNHIYKIHVIFMGYSNVNYIMPSGVYNYPTEDFTAEMVYEFIFTYVKPKWLVNGSEYSIKHSNTPQ